MAERDSKGRFVPGHPPTFTQHKPGHNAGRPKTIKGEVRDALKLAEDAMPELYLLAIQRARGEANCSQAVQQAAFEYLSDRIYGKPNQPINGGQGVPLQSFVFILPSGDQVSARELFTQQRPQVLIDGEVHEVVEPGSGY